MNPNDVTPTGNGHSEDHWLGDGSLRAIHRLATAQPHEKWPASVVAGLTEELIRRRGTDTAWLATHPQEAESHA